MKDIVKLIESRAASDPRLKAVLKKIRNGKASFTDTAYFAEVYSEITGNVFSSVILELDADEREAVCMEILHGNYEAVNDVCVQVQTSLDSESGINIKPQRAPFPTERVAAVAHALTDPSVPENTIKRRAKAPVANVSKSFHDDYIRKNAAFRNDAGLKVWLNRETDGKCCKWCSALAGRYPYSNAPDDIFRRHDNCGCSVTFENGRQRQDVWSKRSWEVPDVGEGAPSPSVLTDEQAEELQQRNLSRFRGLTNSGNGGRINNRKCEIHLNKVQNFFLKPDAKHSKEFFDVGYTQNDIDKLTRDLEACFDYSKAVDKSVSETGVEKFSIFTELGVTKKKRFRTVWQKDTADSVPRIITAHREDG
ncbi:MAG: hypothetical protein PUB97_04790 [Ruminococcus sp.]|nr:hypothetical protein [Ruminococcus sp.]